MVEAGEGPPGELEPAEEVTEQSDGAEQNLDKNYIETVLQY